LLTRSTIRTPIIVHAEETKRVVPFSGTTGFEKERGDGEIFGRFLEGLYILSLCDFTRNKAGGRWDAESACAF